ncbi:DUF4176 domain-containing protein [Aggregatibacter actinomycetemcomitans]|nr:DUF4176 domain-containing protein [Aggregatibacter actinomycetemcomitans]
MNILPLGSVVILKNAKEEKKLMIVVRNPIITKEGVTGYTDYAACVYPVGVEGKILHYFNHQNIKEILFTGYIDELEAKYQKYYLENKGNYKYPKLIF